MAQHENKRASVVEPEAVTTPLADSISSLLSAAFGGGDESALVVRLRADGDMAAEFTVPDADGCMAGYAALSCMSAPAGWLCLAPVAVAPGKQGRGLGTRAVAMALDWARKRNAFVVVLGDPGF